MIIYHCCAEKQLYGGKVFFHSVKPLLFWYNGSMRTHGSVVLRKPEGRLAQCNCFACISGKWSIHCMLIGTQQWLISSHLMFVFNHNRNSHFLPWRPSHQAFLSTLGVLSVLAQWSSWIASTILVCQHRSDFLAQGLSSNLYNISVLE